MATMMAGALCAKLASLLMMRADEISVRKTMSHYGMDSLVAVVSLYSLSFLIL